MKQGDSQEHGNTLAWVANRLVKKAWFRTAANIGLEGNGGWIGKETMCYDTYCLT
jgi:hypothetical protein